MREAVGVRPGTPIVPSTKAEVGTKQTILLVEDEKIIRSLMSELLEREGFKVLACAEPVKAIEVCRRHSGSIDLLLTDVMMPGMNGRELASRVLEMLPELRVMFMSGYTEHVLLDEGLIDAQFEYLQKPFALDTLMQKLRRVLGENETVQ